MKKSGGAGCISSLPAPLYIIFDLCKWVKNKLILKKILVAAVFLTSLYPLYTIALRATMAQHNPSLLVIIVLLVGQPLIRFVIITASGINAGHGQ